MTSRMLSIVSIVVAAGCATAAPPPAASAEKPTSPQPSAAVSAPPPRTRFAENTQQTSPSGAVRFVVPAGWSTATGEMATHFFAPEGEEPIAIVDVSVADADAATVAAWKVFRPGFPWPVDTALDLPGREGWEAARDTTYDVPPNAKRYVRAIAKRAGGRTAVLLIDMPVASFEKQLAQLALISDSMRPAGHERESFAGRTAHALDAGRLEHIEAFIELARRELDIPGVAIAIVQNGKVVQLKGYGVREVGKPQPVDPDTLFLVGSNTKALTTLLLAQLVDEGKLRWDQPAIEVMPAFRLGDEATTQRTQIKHLLCACTGLPRQDFELLFDYENNTPAKLMSALSGIQPTTEFGATFQYSNQLAAAAGYVAAAVAVPGQEIGAAFDRAMMQRVFGPLGMRASTFDFARALRGNRAMPYGQDVDGATVSIQQSLNPSVIPVRPAGGLWSSARDMIRYVQLELDRGVVPGSKRRLVSEANLLERRVAQVKVGEHGSYGMGLAVDSAYGTPIVSHGGSIYGFKADMLWLPEHAVGAVILTNADAGGVLLGAFRRALLEQLFDGKPEALEDLQTEALNTRRALAELKAKLQLPADPAIVAGLAERYVEPKLGELAVRRSDKEAVLDAGGWRSAIATRRNEDGTVSLVMVEPGLVGLPFVIGKTADGKRSLVVRDAQHEYTFVEVGAGG